MLVKKSSFNSVQQKITITVQHCNIILYFNNKSQYMLRCSTKVKWRAMKKNDYYFLHQVYVGQDAVSLFITKVQGVPEIITRFKGLRIFSELCLLLLPGYWTVHLVQYHLSEEDSTSSILDTFYCDLVIFYDHTV